MEFGGRGCGGGGGGMDSFLSCHHGRKPRVVVWEYHQFFCAMVDARDRVRHVHDLRRSCLVGHMPPAPPVELVLPVSSNECQQRGRHGLGKDGPGSGLLTAGISPVIMTRGQRQRPSIPCPPWMSRLDSATLVCSGMRGLDLTNVSSRPRMTNPPRYALPDFVL